MTIQCGRLQLERYVSGELDAKHTEAMKHHLENCSECSEILAQLETERAAFLQKHPFASFSRAHAPLVQLPWYILIRRTVLRPAFIPVYGVLIVVLAVFPYFYSTYFIVDRTVRFKGTNAVSYIYQRDGITHHRLSTDNFRAGDRLQILYSSSKEQYMSLISIDTRGTISFYHPDTRTSTCSIPITSGSSQTYPVSIELDDAPGAELVVALFSDNPLSTAIVSTWAKKQYANDNDLDRLRTAFAESSQEIKADISALLLKKK